MINWFKKKQPIFYCSLPEVLENYPLEPAKSLRPRWVTESAKAYKQEVEEIGTQTTVKGTARCPGIFKLMHRGWILKSWFDLTIIPEQGGRFRLHIPEGFEPYLKQRGYTKKVINWFSGDLVSRAIPLKNGSLDTTIKISTPWTVSVPKGQTLLMLPVTYGDRQDFSCTPGVLEPGDFYDINPIICIHTTEHEVFIPAGTPLMQIMSIQQKDIEIAQILETAEQRARDQAQMYRHSHTFVTKK